MKHVLKLVTAVVAAAAILVPATAVAGDGGVRIAGYQNDKGNKINSKSWDETFYIVGKQLTRIDDFQCYGGKFEGKKQWRSMKFGWISSSKVIVSGNPNCRGFTGPVRGLDYVERRAPTAPSPSAPEGVVQATYFGPDFTITGPDPCGGASLVVC